jgi:hypothetical protein
VLTSGDRLAGSGCLGTSPYPAGDGRLRQTEAVHQDFAVERVPPTLIIGDHLEHQTGNRFALAQLPRPPTHLDRRDGQLHPAFAGREFGGLSGPCTFQITRQGVASLSRVKSQLKQRFGIIAVGGLVQRCGRAHERWCRCSAGLHSSNL